MEQEKQFAQDYLMVMENNDEASYAELIERADNFATSAYQLASELKSEWEHLCQQVYDLVRIQISPIAGELVNEVLNNQGVEAFMIIARDLIQQHNENEVK